MTYFVTIAGQQIDTRDPCAVYQALSAYRLTILSGGQVEEIEINSPVTKRRTRFTPANLPALDAELVRLRTACDAACGAGAMRPSVVYFNTSKGL